MSDQTPTYDLPDEIANQLLCSYCNAYVSCGPVKIQSDGGTICGRCTPLNNEECSPQTLFEVAMTKFKFPCRYKIKGCKERILFGQTMEHECGCPYRTVTCPSLPYGSCSEHVSVFDVHKHFKEFHSDLVLQDGKFKLEFEQDVQCNFLMVKDDVVAILLYIYDSIQNILHLDVRYFSNDDKQVVHYGLRIISGSDSGNIVKVKDRLCQRYQSHAVDMQNSTNLVMSTYLPVLENPLFIYINVVLSVSKGSLNMKSKAVDKLNCLQPSVAACQQSDVEYEKKALAAWNALEPYRCHNCLRCAIPPIVYNVTNRSHYSYTSIQEYICYECIKCDKYNSYRLVEEKINVKDIPCCWRPCTFIGNQTDIKKHVNDCNFRPFTCPVYSLCKIGYYLANNLMDHMQKHGTYCPNPQKIVIDLFSSYGNNTAKNIYFVIFDTKVIALTRVLNIYNWELSSNTENFKAAYYFEHEHCRFKSKTTECSNKVELTYINVKSLYPKCFDICKQISIVMKIVNCTEP